MGKNLAENGLSFLMYGMKFTLPDTIQQAHLKTQEKLLEIELRIVELKEVLDKK